MEDIKKGQETTWEKAVMLASFVAQNVPHDNQKIDLRNQAGILGSSSAEMKASYS